MNRIEDILEFDKKSGTVIGLKINPLKGELIIPNKIEGVEVIIIGKWAFRNCTALTSITVPNRVVGIGEGAFRNCAALTSINIPNHLELIEYHVFFGCVALTSITIPESVTSIGVSAFEYCTKLTVKLTQKCPNKITLGKDYFSRDGEQFKGTKGIIVPSSSLDKYKAHADWGKYSSIMTGY